MKRKTGRRIFISTCGTVVVGTIAGLAGMDAYINGFQECDMAPSRETSPEKTNPLFIYLPRLRENIPWIPLGNFPTPIEELGQTLGVSNAQLWVKRDDISSDLYGGNKVRKLEYLFAEAKIKGCDTVITIGGIGSNHALTTAIIGKSLGFNVELSLFDEPVSAHVIGNLQGFLAARAKIYFSEKMVGAYRIARERFKELKKQGGNPYFIISGGTCGLSNLGHCAAILELKRQMEEAGIPFPDAIFVPVGTCGTVAGLIAGIHLIGKETKVFGVKVYDSFPANSYMIKYYAQNVLNCIQKYTGKFAGKVGNDQFTLLKDYLGKGYGYATPESLNVVSLARPQLQLENTYTGKTLAACLDFCRTAGKGKNVLFWNTYNSKVYNKSEGFTELPVQLKERIEHASAGVNL